MISLEPSEVAGASASLLDGAGRLFFHDGRVLRGIEAEEEASRCRALLGDPRMEEAFQAGLVRTWVAEDVRLRGTALVLEHERIPFAVYPAECTSRMHWESARTTVRVAAALARMGAFPKDAHPWNVLFQRGRARFVDFGSLLGPALPAPSWLAEFRRYYAAPVWLAARGFGGLAQEYRRQHGNGFGLRLFDSAWLRHGPLGGVTRLGRLLAEPTRLAARLDRWLERHPPAAPPAQQWSSYPQAAEAPDPLSPATDKQRFVRDVLAAVRPAKVLDCAANRGFYSEMAARLGASVAAFDVEELCVDACLALARDRDLDITPAIMDFRQPTPPSGWGLAYPDAFERFRSEIVLALGVCHHLCIGQGVPVRLFCEICARFAQRGVILEYVDPTDRHVAAWNRPAPADYSLEAFTAHLARRFPHCALGEPITDDGLQRRMAWFHA